MNHARLHVRREASEISYGVRADMMGVDERRPAISAGRTRAAQGGASQPTGRPDPGRASAAGQRRSLRAEPLRPGGSFPSRWGAGSRWPASSRGWRRTSSPGSRSWRSC